MSRNVSSSTRLLIEAEQKASSIVQEARKAKVQKFKQSKDEAEKDIARYKEASETKFQKHRTEALSGTSDSSVQLTNRKNKAIEIIKTRVGEEKDNVLDFITDLVLNVDTQVSNEQRVHIERKVLQLEESH